MTIASTHKCNTYLQIEDARYGADTTRKSAEILCQDIIHRARSPLGVRQAVNLNGRAADHGSLDHNTLLQSDWLADLVRYLRPGLERDAAVDVVEAPCTDCEVATVSLRV